MKIGGEYRLSNIGLRNWQKFAAELRLNEGLLIDRLKTMAASLPNHAETTLKELESEGLSHVTITRLADRLKARADLCRRQLP